MISKASDKVKQGDQVLEVCVKDDGILQPSGPEECETTHVGRMTELLNYLGERRDANVDPEPDGYRVIGESPPSALEEEARGAAMEWEPISAYRACKINDDGIVRLSGMDFSTLSGCQQKCRDTRGCVAVDFFETTGYCSLYDKACTSPRFTRNGASSYRLMARIDEETNVIHIPALRDFEKEKEALREAALDGILMETESKRLRMHATRHEEENAEVAKGMYADMVEMESAEDKEKKQDAEELAKHFALGALDEEAVDPEEINREKDSSARLGRKREMLKELRDDLPEEDPQSWTRNAEDEDAPEIMGDDIDDDQDSSESIYTFTPLCESCDTQYERTETLGNQLSMIQCEDACAKTFDCYAIHYGKKDQKGVCKIDRGADVDADGKVKHFLADQPFDVYVISRPPP
jgi:hypothetical protein